jgi:tryptophanyl-tRNA synthetase
MRPTGALHIGHYHGALKNWVNLQHEYDCYFFVADWHALTTNYEDPSIIRKATWDTVIDWLAAGVDPNLSTLFVQSFVPEHAELTLLLGMGTPLSWLERVPTYKDQQQKLQDRELATYGFLGYPLMQSADILIYRPKYVPVGEDQVPHIELTREIARRFNHLYGREVGFEEMAETAVKKMGKKAAKLYKRLQREYQEQGKEESLDVARALVDEQQNISMGDRERLLGYLEGSSRIILPEPEAKLTPAAKLPGLDGQKMSKSYNNTIGLREANDSIDQKIRTMTTDPQRVRRTDPGDPEKCPVFDLHRIYSDEKTCAWAADGCRTAGIGCIDCKKPLIDNVIAEIEPMRQRAQEYENDLPAVQELVIKGSENARSVAQDTMAEVRDAMGLVSRQ